MKLKELRKSKIQLDLFREIIIDNFAGGGGASTGIEQATGLSVDVAINHDPASIAMHKVNHPDSEHYCESVWDVEPRKVVKGRPVGLCWLSPDCRHFSKAKGGKPVEKRIRGLAWVAVRWASTVRPRVIMLENVEEFKTWGPVNSKGQPIKEYEGETFKAFVDCLSNGLDENHPAWKEIHDILGNDFPFEMLRGGLGYKVEFRELRACDYGAPTIRKRFFMIARCDGKSIVWPKPTHGDPESNAVKSGILKPWKSASDIIDWSIPCKSIFERKKPLAENTLKRISRGIKKFVIDSQNPYIVNNSANFLISYHNETQENEVRGQDLRRPIHTLDTSNRFALVTSHLLVLRNNPFGQDVRKPLPTITAGGWHIGEVRAFLLKYYGSDIGQSLMDPLHTITTKDRFALVAIAGQKYKIVDIGMRMLQPHELFLGQGFPEDYIIDHDAEGKRYPKKAQVARCGNAVPPVLPKVLVAANCPELCRQNVKIAN